MQIVIDIPDYVYCDIQAYKTIFSDKVEEVAKAIKYGTPLPKGHGRLIDAEILDLENLYRENDDCSFSIVYTKSEFPTIIEADKENE